MQKMKILDNMTILSFLEGNNDQIKMQMYKEPFTWTLDRCSLCKLQILTEISR